MFDSYQIRGISSSSSVNEWHAFGGNDPSDLREPSPVNARSIGNDKMPFSSGKESDLDLKSIRSKAMLETNPAASD